MEANYNKLKAMKVAILLNSLSGGGAEKAMKVLSLELSKLQDLVIIGINKSKSDGIPIISEHYEIERHNRSNLFHTLLAMLKFFHLIRRVKPTHIIVNCALSELFSLLAPASCKLVVVEHVNPAWEGRRILGYCVRKILANKASKLVAVSSHLIFSHSSRSIDLVLENAQPMEELLDLRMGNDEFENLTVESLAFVGRLINPQKRPEFALQIAQASKLPITFYGTGPEMAKLELLAKSTSTVASFKGFQSDVWKDINKNCLTVVTSLYEGDGLVVVEAILMNRPIALIDIPEFRRFKLHSNTYFSSYDDFARYLLLKPPIKKFLPSAEAREFLLSERNPRVLALKWNSLLVSL